MLYPRGSYGRTPLIRAPIGIYAKVGLRVFKARFEREAAIF